MNKNFVFTYPIFRDCFIRTGFDSRMFICGLADSEGFASDDYDELTYFKCMLLLNGDKVIEDESTSTALYENDARDYFQLATEICYLGKF